MHGSTQSIFRTAYYIAKSNRLFSDHYNLIEVQDLNGIKLGNTLYSRCSATNIIDHVSCKMKNRIIANIIETNAKLSILIDESTTISTLYGMIVYMKVTISCGEIIYIFRLSSTRKSDSKKYSKKIS